MAWIKVDTLILEKPEIRRAARECGVSVGEAFAAFFRLYAWLDGITADGIVEETDRARVDAKAELAGFAASLERSGWIRFTDEGTMYVTNYCEHNGTSAKARALHAKRSARYKEKFVGSETRLPKPPNRHHIGDGHGVTNGDG